MENKRKGDRLQAPPISLSAASLAIGTPPRNQRGAGRRPKFTEAESGISIRVRSVVVVADKAETKSKVRYRIRGNNYWRHKGRRRHHHVTDHSPGFEKAENQKVIN
jgi:hypothetical protein